MQADEVRKGLAQGRYDASDLAAMYADGSLTPSALIDACLQAIADEGDGVFIAVTAGRARAEAAAASERWRQGTPLSPFDGLPVAWKDLFDIAGVTTTAGSATRFAAPPAERDAPLAAVLARAGLVCLGKTNLSEFAFSGLGLNPTFGTPPIVADDGRRYAPGGSSSGAGRAIALGLAAIAIGSDTAGSARIPAAFNGVVGYRASRGRYPADGMFPLAASLDTVGILCRSPRDARRLDAIIIGEDPPLAAPPPRLRVDNLALAAAETAIQKLTDAALSRLADAGYVIDDRPLPAFHEALAWIDRHGWPGAREAWRLHAPLLASPQAQAMDPRVRERLQAAAGLPDDLPEIFLARRAGWQQQLRRELDGALLVTPATAHFAPELAPLEKDDALFAQTNLATLRLTMPGSLLDMPGVTLPVGKRRDGLAAGLLFSLPPGEDRRLLAAACGITHIFATPPLSHHTE